MKVADSSVDLQTASGPMRCFLATPVLDCELNHRVLLPAVIVFTEIYQITAPLKRFCRSIAAEGYIVICGECYHEFEPMDTVLAYDDAGTNRGNLLKVTKKVEQYDSDNIAMVTYLLSRSDCNGRIGTVGMCLGGHLSLRCAFLKEIVAGVCFFATDVHSHSLGEGKNDDTLLRCARDKDLFSNSELLMIFGRQDPHIPRAGRELIHKTLEDAHVKFAWVEVNAEHAFIRDESSKGRFNPSITKVCVEMMLELFRRKLHVSSKLAKL